MSPAKKMLMKTMVAALAVGAAAVVFVQVGPAAVEAQQTPATEQAQAAQAPAAEQAQAVKTPTLQGAAAPQSLVDHGTSVADHGCNGELLSHLALTVPGSSSVDAFTDVYYHGNNEICAVTYKTSSLAGKYTTTGVYLQQCEETYSSNCTVRDSRSNIDEQPFATPPVAMYMGNHCFQVVGEVYSEAYRGGTQAWVSEGPYCFV